MSYLIKKPVMNDASEMLAQAATGATAIGATQPVPTPGLLKVLHDRDVPGDGELVYAEIELLPEGTTLEDALFRAMEVSKDDAKVWEVFVVSLVPVDGVEGKALIDHRAAQPQAPERGFVNPVKVAE